MSKADIAKASLVQDQQIKLPLGVLKKGSASKKPFKKTDANGWRSTISSINEGEVPSSEYAVSLNEKSDMRVLAKPNLSMQSIRQLELASILLAIAAGIAILLGLAMVFLPGGKDAVPAMGGVLQASAPLETAQIVFMLDILFPITFGAGFALLANAFQCRGNRPIVRMILTALLLVVLADFSENALVFKTLTGGEVYVAQWPLTVIKYAMLALSAVLLSTIININVFVGMTSMIFLRYGFPILIALLVSGIGGRVAGDVVGASFPLGLILLSIYAMNLSKA